MIFICLSKKITFVLLWFQKKHYLCRTFCGGLAQLARAFDWQSKGQGFDSPNLHKNC